jgi:hypothetical protein
VLVCDAVDPNITFVVPLAAAVVERREGMPQKIGVGIFAEAFMEYFPLE